MGYTTDFTGAFKLNKPLDDETYNLLVGLATTRRIKRAGLDGLKRNAAICLANITRRP